MPIVQINLFEGRSLEQKRKLVEKVTEAICEALGAPKERVRIILYEMSKENFAVAGKLALDTN